MKKLERLIFICTGNTCRSPMACAIARREAAARALNIAVDCAGVAASIGQPASEGARSACMELGLDLSRHRAKQADRSLYSPHTLFAVMTPGHADWLHSVCGVPAENIILLGLGIPDPYGQPIEGYRAARDAISDAVSRLLDAIAPLTGTADTANASAPGARLTVSPTRECDIAAIAEIEAQCFSDPWTAAGFAEELSCDNADMFTAATNGEVCGYGLIITAGGVSELPKICIAPAHRRQGMGRVLLQRLEEAARQRGSEELTLEVRLSNTAAQSLYASLGFERIGIRPGFYRSPTEDAVIMTKPLG